MEDLAVGSHPFGADVWTQQELVAATVAVGAPPDMYNQLGQAWAMRPWRPDALARDGYRAYRAMLRAVLRNCGAVRIDHVLGLFRMWWVPDGASPRDGAYVTYDHEAMVGILCLEAQRAGAVIIGEDLGTVEPWVSGYLAERGVLGTTVQLFEKSWDGSPRPPQEFRRSVLTTVTTHDLPPTAGFLAGEHVELRAELGLLTAPVDQERARARAERDSLVTDLQRRGLVGPDPSPEEVVRGLYAFIGQTPSLLLGVALVDAVGERRAQNQPGTDREYPNWTVPLAAGDGRPVYLDDLFDLPGMRALADVMNAALAPPLTG
jgi:4-alpha-glucanotransferase